MFDTFLNVVVEASYSIRQLVFVGHKDKRGKFYKIYIWLLFYSSLKYTVLFCWQLVWKLWKLGEDFSAKVQVNNH